MVGWLISLLGLVGWLVGWCFCPSRELFSREEMLPLAIKNPCNLDNAQRFRFLLQCRMSRKNTCCLSFSCSWIIYSFWTNGVCILFITSHVLSIPPVPSKECFELPKTQLQVTFAVFNLLIEIYFTKEDWCFNFL